MSWLNFIVVVSALWLFVAATERVFGGKRTVGLSVLGLERIPYRDGPVASYAYSWPTAISAVLTAVMIVVNGYAAELGKIAVHQADQYTTEYATLVVYAIMANLGLGTLVRIVGGMLNAAVLVASGDHQSISDKLGGLIVVKRV